MNTFLPKPSPYIYSHHRRPSPSVKSISVIVFLLLPWDAVNHEAQESPHVHIVAKGGEKLLQIFICYQVD